MGAYGLDTFSSLAGRATCILSRSSSPWGLRLSKCQLITTISNHQRITYPRPIGMRYSRNVTSFISIKPIDSECVHPSTYLLSEYINTNAATNNTPTLPNATFNITGMAFSTVSPKTRLIVLRYLFSALLIYTLLCEYKDFMSKVHIFAVHSASIGFVPMQCTLKRTKTSHIASSGMGGLLYKATWLIQYN